MNHLKIVAIPVLSSPELDCTNRELAEITVRSVLFHLSETPESKTQRILFVAPTSEENLYLVSLIIIYKP